MFDQTFQGLGLGKLFPARESLVSDILAGDGKSLNFLFTVSKDHVCFFKFTHVWSLAKKGGGAHLYMLYIFTMTGKYKS